MTRRGLGTGLALVAALLLGVAIGQWAGGGVRLIDARVSPDGRQRVELYAPGHLQRLLAGRMDLPVFARVSRVADSRPLGDSPVFDASGAGETFWPREGGVQIGAAAAWNAQQGWRIAG